MKTLSDKTSLVNKQSKWTKARNEVIGSEDRLRVEQKKFEEAKAKPDETERMLAEVEQQQAEAAQDRMENATAMSVASLRKSFLIIRNTSKKR